MYIIVHLTIVTAGHVASQARFGASPMTNGWEPWQHLRHNKRALSLWVCNLLLIFADSENAVQLKKSSPFKSHKCQNILLHPFAAKNINECCMWRKVKKRKRTLYQYSTSRCQTDWRPSSGAWPLCLLLASSHWWRLTKLIKQFQHVSTCLIKQLWQSRARYASTILSMCSNFCSFLLYLYLPYFRCKNKSAISSSWNLSACQHQPFAKQENHGETIDNLNRALAQPGKFALAQL